mgnify:CR=1 FL=1
MKHPFGHVKQRDDGKWLLDLELPTQKPLFLPDKWTPATAIKANQEMLRHVASKAGKLEARVLSGQLHANMDLPVEEVIEIGDEVYIDTVDSWKKPMTMLADESFAKMMLAASLSAPMDQLHPEEVIAPSGTLYFEKPILLTPLYEDLKGDPKVDPIYYNLISRVPVRGIHWGEMGFDGIGAYLLADGKDAKEFEENVSPRGDSKDNPLSPVESYRCLSPITFSPMLWDIDDKPHPTTARHIALMRALNAIIRSPLTQSQQPKPLASPITKKKRSRRTKTRPVDVSQIRLISLRKPADADKELGAATGVKQRAYWVRGHWRNHWYPKKQEHRTMWIEGHAKGNPELGVVGSKKVYLAKGDKPR